jgi:Short C-terminal domain
LIFENRWATPFVEALRRGEAQLIAAGYIPQDTIAASLDATERR